MFNKKGLSDVVTSVMLILLAVIAVSAVAYFVYPMIKGSGSKIQQAEACMTASLEVPNCLVTATGANVTVRRNAGTATIKEIRLIFEKGDGSTEVVSESPAPGELGTNVYSRSLNFNATRVSVAAGVADDKGNVNYCNPTQPVACR